MKIKHGVLAAVLVAVAAVAVWKLEFDTAEGPVQFQGYVEGQLTLIGPEEGGRITVMLVSEGDEVSAGALLFELDASIQTSQLAEAQARLREAQARQRNLQDQQMRAQEISVLKAREQRVLAHLDLSEKELDRKSKLFLQRVVPQSQVDAAQAAVDSDKADLADLRRQIEVAHMGARSEQIAEAQAGVEAASAAARQASIRLSKRKVNATRSGRIQEVYFRAGEVVSAGQPVIGLLPPDKVKVRFFVPEPKLPELGVGTQVGVSCDSCPEGLSAVIDFVSREAEFTPPVIYGPKERSKLVFRVEARPQGAAQNLSPGQPVTVTPMPAGSEKQGQE